ncbi:uncharacterized protein LOC135468721 [Liolophura sinensis]|uniref:uncharacterized protein LOC135468721 n=1 Tax=Liolophura sinensis TaxID=3198878 RepID=UPI0031598AF0
MDTSLSSEVPDLVTEVVIDHLNPEHVIDHLYQDRVISEDEMQIIAKSATRKEKCRFLISHLSQHPNPKKNFESLIRALNAQGYDFLVPSVKAILDKDSAAKSANGTQNAPTKAFGSSTLPTGTEVDLVCLSFLPPAGGGLRSSKQLRHIFNRLSTMLNSGNVREFAATCDAILGKGCINFDVRCIVKYLQACRLSFNDSFVAAKMVIKDGKDISRKTSSPVQYMVYLLSCQCWIYIKSKKFAKLNSCLTDAEQLISTNSVLCQGMAAGWIRLDRAQYILPLITSKYPEKASGLIKRVCALLDQGREQFQREESRDGPYGIAYSLILKAIVLLRCGSVMDTLRLPVSDEDIHEAEILLAEADASEIGLPQVLRAIYYIAMSDLNVRRGRLARAQEYAHQALEVATSLTLPEFLRKAEARIDYLTAQTERLDEKVRIVDTCRVKCARYIRAAVKPNANHRRLINFCCELVVLLLQLNKILLFIFLISFIQC